MPDKFTVDGGAMLAGRSSIATAEEVLNRAPTPVTIEGARQRIRASHVVSGRRIAVVDDDPTGSQAVHDVNVVTVFEDEEYAWGLDTAGSTCFILTNTRSMQEAAAVELNTRVGRGLCKLADRLDAPVDVVSRSDSTLRGHVVAEVRALDAVQRNATGRGYDAVLLVPAYFEAGRFTADDIHWARVEGELLQVGATEFARDATFGYRASNLREFLAEKSGGAVSPGDVCSITLRDIRIGGPQRVSEILDGVAEGAFVVVNATGYPDLEIVVLGVMESEERGRAFLYRTGPSFVRALAGIEPQDPLTAEQIWPAGHPGGHGLIVVGSHVGLTSRQVTVARQRSELVGIELDVATVTDPSHRDAYLADITRRVVSGLAGSDVLLFTSRTLMRGRDAADSLQIARTVSSALTEVTRGGLNAKPSWVVAKGGITAHDVAVRGFGIRRAKVLGQLLPGMVSVFQPVDAARHAVGTPYVVFAGNVGDENTLAQVISVLSGSG